MVKGPYHPNACCRERFSTRGMIPRKKPGTPCTCDTQGNTVHNTVQYSMQQNTVRRRHSKTARQGKGDAAQSDNGCHPLSFALWHCMAQEFTLLMLRGVTTQFSKQYSAQPCMVHQEHFLSSSAVATSSWCTHVPCHEHTW